MFLFYRTRLLIKSKMRDLCSHIHINQIFLHNGIVYLRSNNIDKIIPHVELVFSTRSAKIRLACCKYM